jgi:hypothetical protein
MVPDMDVRGIAFEVLVIGADLNLAGADFDVANFDALIAAGDQASLTRAVELYSGPLLEGCAEEWSLEERVTRKSSWIAALETVGRAEVAKTTVAAKTAQDRTVTRTAVTKPAVHVPTKKHFQMR